MGAYRLELRVDGVELTSRYLEVGRIIKPAYRVDLTTGRRVYVAGDRIRVTATARFFEGTPVPGVPIRLDGDLTGSMTTDASGTATVRKTVRWGIEDEPRDGPRLADISAWPARAEEGDGQLGSRGYLVFPSHWMVSGEATLVGRQLRLSGSANEVDRDRLEREITDGRSMWDIDPAGKGLAGKTVRARIVESIPIRRQVGTSYDFLEKRVVPIYEYDQRTQIVTTMRLKTGVSGRFFGSVRIPDVRHNYEIELSITDPDGLRATSTVSVYSKDDVYSADRSPSLQSTAYRNPEDRYGRSVGIGDQIDMTMHEPDASGSVGKDPHLFFASQGGIRDAIIRTSDRYVTTFPEWGAPNVVYRAIRFTGKTYVTTGPYVASFRVADRKITVKVSTDRARYGPGGTARLSVTTLGPDGRPIAASIVIRAVDESCTRSVTPWTPTRSRRSMRPFPRTCWRPMPPTIDRARWRMAPTPLAAVTPRARMTRSCSSPLRPTPLAERRSRCRCPAISPRGTSPSRRWAQASRPAGRRSWCRSAFLFRRHLDRAGVPRRGSADHPAQGVRVRSHGGQRGQVLGRCTEPRPAHGGSLRPGVHRRQPRAAEAHRRTPQDHDHRTDRPRGEPPASRPDTQSRCRAVAPDAHAGELLRADISNVRLALVANFPRSWCRTLGLAGSCRSSTA